MKRIYLDHAATTPLLPQAAEAMAAWSGHEFGNPSSLHAEGRAAKHAVDETREAFSEALGCLFGEIVFTSSGTEAANLALIGAALGNENPARNRILLGASEHHCVLHTKPLLERLGYRVDLIPVNHEALIDLNWLQDQAHDDLLMVSVMQANNEFGTVQPVAEVSAWARDRGVLIHRDSVQTFPGAWTVDEPYADLVTVSAHKFNGPKGVGAAYVRAGTKVAPIALGGGQEREMRAGTENVAGLVGAAAALRCHRENGSTTEQKRIARDAFASTLSAAFQPTVRSAPRLSGHHHVRLPGVDAEIFLIRLDKAGVSASSGAACSSGSLEPSHVMMAAGFSETEAREGLRFTFGFGVSESDAFRAAKIVNETAEAILLHRR
ncbi:MAG: cysteine desulfurase [Armatimonadetes bacterium]|nr:cysteine desulfurase [Armatimonadota bacterium]